MPPKPRNTDEIILNPNTLEINVLYDAADVRNVVARHKKIYGMKKAERSPSKNLLFIVKT